MMSTEGFIAPTASPVQRSAWHSPVPYLFGGLAAMLGLIAFALLILACSYWRLSGYLDRDTPEDNNSNSSAADRDIELGGGGDANNSDEKPQHIPVIMPGQEKPTFLATPVSSRASSFGSNSLNSREMTEKSEDERTQKPKQGTGDQVQTTNMETHENSDQIP